MITNYTGIFNFTAQLNSTYENLDHNFIAYGGKEHIVFPEPIEGSNEEILYFLKIEKLYFNKQSFPVKINLDQKDITPKYAVLKLDRNSKLYYQYVASNVGSNKEVFSKANETVISHNVLCRRVNEDINKYVSGLKDTNNLFVPSFDIEDNDLVCKYVNKNPQSSVTLENSKVLGFDHHIYELIGRFFNCEWGKKNKDDTELFYYVYPFINEIGNVRDEIYANNQVDDFFYPERTLKIEFTLNDEAVYDRSQQDYKLIEIPFRDKESIFEINKYILFANNKTVTTNEVTHHSFRISVEIDENYFHHTFMGITVKGKIIPLKDKYDQFALFNISPGDVYSEEQYIEISFRKLLNLTATNVHLENNESTVILEELKNRIETVFRLYDNMEDNNITLTLRKIYDVISQTQEITSLGPPTTKHSKINL